MATYTNVCTGTMWQSPSGTVQRQCDIAESVSSLDDGSAGGRIDRNFLQTAEVDYKRAIVTTEPISNVAMLIASWGN